MTERGDSERRTPASGWGADLDMAPGGPRAVARGCLCSVLANAAFRARADVEPFLDPRCPVHADGARS